MIIAVIKQFYSVAIIFGLKKNRATTGFEPMTFALLVRCSTNWAMKPSTLGAGQFVGFIRPGVKGMNRWICIYI